MLLWGYVHAQQPEKFIVLPTLDTTLLTTMVARPGAGYLIVTRQNGNILSGSTLISTDVNGDPLNAVRTTDVITKVVLCPDSGYLMLCEDATLLKTDPQLNIEWARRFSAPPPTWSVGEIAEKNGYYYMTAIVRSEMIDTFQVNYGTNAAVIYKFDSAGDLFDQAILADTSHTPDQFDLYGPTIAFGDDGTVYLTMSLRSGGSLSTCTGQPAVVKMDSGLQVQWSYRYPMSDYSSTSGSSMLRAGTLALYGSYGPNTTTCNFKHFLQIIDTSGAVVLAKDYYHSFYVAAHGTGRPILLADSTLLFPQTYREGSPLGTKQYFHRIDAQGNTIGSKRFTNTDLLVNRHVGLALVNDGTIGVCRLNSRDTLLFTTIDTSLTTACYTLPDTIVESSVGVFRSAFDPSYLEHTFTVIDTLYPPFQPVPVNSVMDCDFTTAIGSARLTGANVFPNPTRGSVNITNPLPISDLVITDALGRVVYRSTPSKTHASVEILSSGLYIIRIADSQGDQVRKLIVEEH
jgi:hypothetical protein